MGVFKEIPKTEWPNNPDHLNRAFMNDEFLVQEYKYPSGRIRLSVNFKKRMGDNWKDGITWDQLQHIKRMIGYGDKCAVEIYPPDKDIVNVANIRHLWITDMPEFAWSKQ